MNSFSYRKNTGTSNILFWSPEFSEFKVTPCLSFNPASEAITIHSNVPLVGELLKRSGPVDKGRGWYPTQDFIPNKQQSFGWTDVYERSGWQKEKEWSIYVNSCLGKNAQEIAREIALQLFGSAKKYPSGNFPSRSFYSSRLLSVVRVLLLHVVMLTCREYHPLSGLINLKNRAWRKLPNQSNW